jgi:sulfonate transport system permease protein
MASAASQPGQPLAGGAGHSGPGRSGLGAAEALLAPLALLALWQLACLSGAFPPQVMVPPGEVLKALIALAHTGELQRHVGESLGRLAAGFAIGALAGLAFGVALALSRWADAALSPLFLALWQVPVIAFVPMLVMFLGIEERFKISIVAIAAFFPIALATIDGVRGVPRAWLEVARVYRTPLPTLIWRILVPATVPPVLTGLRIALTRAWLVLIAIELLAADSGIGQMMEMGRQLFRIDTVLAGVVVSGVVGFALDAGARAIERRATRWKRA